MSERIALIGFGAIGAKVQPLLQGNSAVELVGILLSPDSRKPDATSNTALKHLFCTDLEHLLMCKRRGL